jgi:aminopeptidase
VLRAGAYPYVLVRGYPSYLPGLEGLDYILYSEANDDQLSHVDFISRKVLEDFDVSILVYTAYNTRSLSNIEPNRMKIHRQAYKDVIKTYFERTASGDLRRVDSYYPCDALAQEADMSLEEYTNFIFSTTYCDTDNPVGKWKEIHQEQGLLVDWLKGKKKVEVTGPDIDLKFSIEERSFSNGDGKENMPCGEIFTGPVEDSVNGWVRFSYPAIYTGLEVQGVELKFKDGKVVEASAEKNQDFLNAMLETDAGSRYLGEFGIGTNSKITRFMKDILFDEKIKGTVHFALGAGYPETGSVNESAIHWDMICELRNGGQILVDDEVFFEDGEFKI